MKKSFTVAVLGSSGYVGLELVKILQNHPNVSIKFLGSENSPNLNLSFFDKYINDENLPKLSLNKDFNSYNFDVVFLALPHGISHNYINKFYNKIKIIDLSADFRLDSLNSYEANYNLKHSCANLLNEFIYGLPEINREKIIKSSNIAIPGCYPTSVLLPLIPLLIKKLLKVDNLIIDSKSGYSGAGKKFDLANIKNNNDLNFYNYNTNDHRHICEIQQELQKHSDKKVNFLFNPHILPSFRGMMSTIYCDLNHGISYNDIIYTLKDFSKNLPFVHLIDNNQRSDFFSIQHSNDCFIKIYKHSNDTKIIIVSLIDNLIKGAAGQAVQCFNIISNLDEKLSLIK